MIQGPDRRPRIACIPLTALLCVISMCGCVSPTPVVLQNPVGSWKPHLAADEGSGRLIVYSATRVTTSDQSEYPVHTPYTIYGPGEKLVRRVNNTSGLFSQSPATVSLPAGEYRVKALATDAGFVIVPVIIEAHQTTVVDLDGTALPQGVQSNADADAPWVRLPNGHVAGAPGH
jgi:hypothetical protein